MEIQITAIHFEPGDELRKYITDRINGLHDDYGKFTNAEVSLRETHPGEPENKEVMVSLMYPGAPDQVATEKRDTYEEALNACTEALKKELEKLKDRNRPI